MKKLTTLVSRDFVRLDIAVKAFIIAKTSRQDIFDRFVFDLNWEYRQQGAPPITEQDAVDLLSHNLFLHKSGLAGELPTSAAKIHGKGITHLVQSTWDKLKITITEETV